MSLLPDDIFKKSASLNLAPMVDFLFLVLAVFATIAITRAALFDTEVELVQLKTGGEESPSIGFNQSQTVNISITDSGQYRWISEANEFLIDGPLGIRAELCRQQREGLLPQNGADVKVLLHIDKDAKWDTVAQAVFAIREAGFQVNPVYSGTSN